MAKTYKNGAEILAERAQEPNPTSHAETKVKIQTRIPQDSEPPRRMIYSGTMPVPPQTDAPAGTHLPPKNRKIIRRKVSPFNIILMLMGLATAIVLYIGNIIAVDQLVNDIHKQELKLQEILNEQEMLRAKVNQMSSLERIRKRAEEELGLQNPSTAPKWLRVDSEKAREVEEALPKR